MFRTQMLKPDVWKQYVEAVRPAKYPDLEDFGTRRGDIEASWPAFAKVYSLCRPPKVMRETDVAARGTATGPEDFLSEGWKLRGQVFVEHYEKRLQHVMAHMNHHIHPYNKHTGEREPLKSCRRKDKPKDTKCGFPLDDQMLEESTIVCQCLAQEREWCTSGPRSLLGCVLPSRNDPWLNAGPSAWMIFTGDNGDMKFHIGCQSYHRRTKQSFLFSMHPTVLASLLFPL